MQTRVAVVKCESYSPENIAAALGKIFASLGGLKQFVPPGGSVLIKPNLLSDRAPDKAVTTHPEVVRALVRMVRQCGGNPMIGDSPAGTLKIDAVIEKTGFRALCEEEKVKFAIFEKEPCVIHDYRGVSLAVARAAFDADLIINVPKLKTHSFTAFTNAVKNVFGLLPGFQKALLHKTFPTPRLFGDCLAFLYGIIRPGLTVCDAITAMEGEGPSAGTPVQLGFLAGSADGIALDMSLCRMLGINPDDVLYLDSLRRSGLGQSNPDNIELAGDYSALGHIRPIKQSVTAKAAQFIPLRLVRLIEQYLWIRPSFTGKCTACRRCVEACPAGALTLNTASQDARPRLSIKKCISCCCCHEICPEHAIKMTRSFLLRLASLRNFKYAT